LRFVASVSGSRTDRGDRREEKKIDRGEGSLLIGLIDGEKRRSEYFERRKLEAKACRREETKECAKNLLFKRQETKSVGLLNKRRIVDFSARSPIQFLFFRATGIAQVDGAGRRRRGGRRKGQGQDRQGRKEAGRLKKTHKSRDRRGSIEQKRFPFFPHSFLRLISKARLSLTLPTYIIPFPEH